MTSARARDGLMGLHLSRGTCRSAENLLSHYYYYEDTHQLTMRTRTCRCAESVPTRPACRQCCWTACASLSSPVCVTTLRHKPRHTLRYKPRYTPRYKPRHSPSIPCRSRPLPLDVALPHLPSGSAPPPSTPRPYCHVRRRCSWRRCSWRCSLVLSRCGGPYRTRIELAHVDSNRSLLVASVTFCCYYSCLAACLIFATLACLVEASARVS